MLMRALLIVYEEIGFSNGSVEVYCWSTNVDEYLPLYGGEVQLRGLLS